MHLKEFKLDSIANFTRAIELRPDDASAYTSRGIAHYEKAEYERAIADLSKAIELNPRSALAHCHLGWTFEATGDEPQAIAHYRKALEIDPTLEAARDNLKLLGAMREPQPVETEKSGTDGGLGNGYPSVIALTSASLFGRAHWRC